MADDEFEKKLYTRTTTFTQAALTDPGSLGEIAKFRLRKVNPALITIVQGCYDHIEDLIPGASVISSDQLSDLTIPEPKGHVMCVNCGSGKDEDTAKVQAQLQTIEKFVGRGGKLITTDWALRDILSRSSELNLVQWDETRSDQHSYVDVFASCEEANAMLPVSPSLTPYWYIEQSSFLVGREDITEKGQGRVKIFLESNQLAEQKNGKGVICFGFPYGEGFVIHYVSHLRSQRLANLPKKGQSQAVTQWAAQLSNGEINDDEKAAWLLSAYTTQQALTHSILYSPDPTKKGLRVQILTPQDVRPRIKYEGREVASDSLDLELDGMKNVNVGRGDNCVLQTSDPSLSREHALIYAQGNQPMIVDLDSTNGTYIKYPSEDAPRKVETPMVLTRGAVVKAGVLELLIIGMNEN